MGSGDDFSEVVSLLGSGKLEAVIDQALPLSQAQSAHELLESGQVLGKIVLQPGS